MRPPSSQRTAPVHPRSCWSWVTRASEGGVRFVPPVLGANAASLANYRVLHSPNREALADGLRPQAPSSQAMRPRSEDHQPRQLMRWSILCSIALEDASCVVMLHEHGHASIAKHFNSATLQGMRSSKSQDLRVKASSWSSSLGMIAS